MTTQWIRVEGMIIGEHVDPDTVGDHLRERGVLAQLEWFEHTPQLLGINVTKTDDDRIGVLLDGATEPVPGPPVEELAEEVAALLEAEFRLGPVVADHLPTGSAPLADVADRNRDAGPSRIAEIGRTPSSSVPLLAALEGIDLGSLDLPEGHRALLAELPADKAGWNFGELPLVSLTLADGEFQAFLVTDDHLENVVTHNWAMSRTLIPGSLPSALPLDQQWRDLVDDGVELEQIAQAVPGADVAAMRRTATVSGPDAVRAVVAALGLPSEVAQYLLSEAELEDLEGINVHLARGISTAIGRSVDIMLGDTDSAIHPGFAAYRALNLDHPWIIRAGASVEAAIGASLVVLAARTRAPRSPWVIAGGILGGLMVVDSVAEMFLTKYVAARRNRS